MAPRSVQPQICCHSITKSPRSQKTPALYAASAESPMPATSRTLASVGVWRGPPKVTVKMPSGIVSASAPLAPSTKITA